MKVESLSIDETRKFYNILISKKKQEPDFSAWLKSQQCIVLSLNEFIICCFNDKRLQENYFAIKYPPYTFEEFFPPNVAWSGPTTITTSGGTNPLNSNKNSLSNIGLGNITLSSSNATNSGCITYTDDNYHSLNIVLFPKDKLKKILMLDSFDNKNHI
jgi:hypothetical protein